MAQLWTLVEIASEADLWQRVTAAAALEGEPAPVAWTDQHRWRLAASPGWGEAWESAMASGAQQIGRDGAVITDGMILAAVQAVRGTNA